MAEEKKKDELNYQFVSLVFSLQQAAMAQLGKITNSATGKMEKNLIQAKATIDMIEMLKEKSEGNLTDTEQKIILNTLDNLYLNYADEVATADLSAEAQPARRSPQDVGGRAKAEATEKKPATADLSAEAQPARRSPQDVGGRAKAEAAEKPKEEKKPSSASPSAKATADKKATEGKPRPPERSEGKEEKKE